MQLPSFQVKNFKLHRIVNVPSGQVVEGFTILRTLESISLKRIVCLCLSLSLSVCLDAFAQILSYYVQTSLECQRIPGTGRGGVHDSTLPQRGQKLRVNHSKNVISTCNRTVFKIRSSNFTGMSMTPRDRLWRGSQFIRTPRWVRNNGLITQKR